MPRVFDVSTCDTMGLWEARLAICAAFEAARKGKNGRKAAQHYLARRRLEPAALMRLALDLYNNHIGPMRACSSTQSATPLVWLKAGSGCTARTGTTHDGICGAWDALYATVSILLEVPVERAEDESALLGLLHHIGWRMPDHQRKRAERRFTAYVSFCLRGRADELSWRPA